MTNPQHYACRTKVQAQISKVRFQESRIPLLTSPCPRRGGVSRLKSGVAGRGAAPDNASTPTRLTATEDTEAAARQQHDFLIRRKKENGGHGGPPHLVQRHASHLSRRHLRPAPTSPRTRGGQDQDESASRVSRSFKLLLIGQH